MDLSMVNLPALNDYLAAPGRMEADTTWISRSRGAEGTLRINFTTADLARTQVPEDPDPMWEIVLSLHMLNARYGRLAFAEWRSRVRADLRRHTLENTVRMLALIVSDGRYFPDFLTPPEGLRGVDAGIEAVVATLHTRIRKELDR